ncbi:MAG: TRAP transporter small permease [Planctomycetes bacterium]|nr:TRAP transporter small permease [Planctomycetota bacterium]
MRKLASLVSKSLRMLMAIGMSAGLLGLILTVLLQVFARAFLPKVPSWTEEISRFFLIYMVGCGAGIVMHKKAFVNVDLIINLLPVRLKSLLTALIDLAICVLMWVFSHQAIRHLALGRRQTSPSLYIPMQYIFFALVIMGIGILIFAAGSCLCNLYCAAVPEPAKAEGQTT